MPHSSQREPAAAPGKKAKKGRNKRAPLPDSDEDADGMDLPDRCPHSMSLIREYLTHLYSSTVRRGTSERLLQLVSLCGARGSVCVTLLPLTCPPPIPSRPLQCSMQLDQMSMGFSMDAAPWKRVNIDRAKWKVRRYRRGKVLAPVMLPLQDIGDIMCVEALDGAEASK